MTYRVTALERAFELARSGNYPSIADIKRQLNAEGLSAAQVTGAVLVRQLRELIQQAKNR